MSSDHLSAEGLAAIRERVRIWPKVQTDYREGRDRERLLAEVDRLLAMIKGQAGEIEDLRRHWNGTLDALAKASERIARLQDDQDEARSRGPLLCGNAVVPVPEQPEDPAAGQQRSGRRPLHLQGDSMSSTVESTKEAMVAQYAATVHESSRASDDEKAGRVLAYGRGLEDGLALQDEERRRDDERFCHLCFAGLESSQHNTSCVGSDRGLEDHDRKVASDAVRAYADQLGVYVGDEDSEYYRGYRQAQREAIQRADRYVDQLAAGDQS